MNVRDYKEGMVAGAKPFEEKFREIQNANIAALQKLCCENSNSIGELIDVAEEHDNLLNYEWKKNYELSDYAEKAIFIGFLMYCINIIESDKEADNNQKAFITDLCKKFQIDPYQIKILDISKLKNNDNIAFQNLLYMCICNYFYLSDENFKFEKRFDDEIFQYFRVSKNDKKEIHELIEWTTKHLDLENLFALEEEQPNILQELEEDTIGCSTLDKLDDFLNIQELYFVKSEEESTICNKRINFEANLKIDGKLLLKNCYIQYGINDSFITINKEGEVTFENCTFDYSNKGNQYFIKSLGNITFNKCLFINCWGLCDARKVTINKSNIIYNNSFNFELDSNNCKYLFDCNVYIYNSYISGGFITLKKEKEQFEHFYIFNTITECKECVFKECIRPSTGWSGLVINSDFTKCSNIFNNCWPCRYTIQETVFNYCESIFNIKDDSESIRIEGCKFNGCSNCLINLDKSKLFINNCEFRNLFQDINPSSYILITDPINTELIIQNSIFDNLSFIDYGYLIKVQGTMTEKDHCKISISDCMFGKVERKTSNPVIDSKIICISYWISKQTSKKILLSSNNTGIDDLLKSIESQHNNKIINELEAIVNEYLPRFGFNHYSKKDIFQNKKAAKKFSILKKIIPNLETEIVLGFIDLSVTGNVNDHLVFTSEKCYYHSISTIWSYYYNHPELSSGKPFLFDNGEKRKFNVDENFVKNKDFIECISKLESVLK